jgi:hypothetical protein
MTLTIYAPSPEAAALLARRVRPRARIGDIEEQPTAATRESLAAFWGEVKRLTATSPSTARARRLSIRKTVA